MSTDDTVAASISDEPDDALRLCHFVFFLLCSPPTILAAQKSIGKRWRHCDVDQFDNVDAFRMSIGNVFVADDADEIVVIDAGLQSAANGRWHWKDDGFAKIGVERMSADKHFVGCSHETRHFSGNKKTFVVFWIYLIGFLAVGLFPGEYRRSWRFGKFMHFVDWKLPADNSFAVAPPHEIVDSDCTFCCVHFCLPIGVPVGRSTWLDQCGRHWIVDQFDATDCKQSCEQCFAFASPFSIGGMLCKTFLVSSVLPFQTYALQLQENPLTSLDGLESLMALTVLQLDNCQLTTVALLHALTNLTTLTVCELWFFFLTAFLLPVGQQSVG